MFGLPAFRQPVARRILLSFLALAAALPACAQVPPAAGINPEQFGARGDGRSDDSRAVAAALNAAASRGQSVELSPGRVYALGAPGWAGLRSNNGIAINGNGATLKLRALPRQTLPAGVGHALLRVDGGAVRISHVNFDLGGLDAAALAVDRVQLDLRDNSFSNGRQGSANSYGLFAVRSSGIIAGNSGTRIGHLFYVGHTDRGMHSSRLEISGNRANQLYGDFVVGVLRDSVIQSNTSDGMFSGVALAAFDHMQSYSENVSIVGNTFVNFRGHGVQTDVVGNIRDRRIRVADNHISGGGPGSAGIYLIRVDDFDVSGNQIDSADYGIVLDNASNGALTGNTLTAGGAHRTRGIGLVASIGDIRSVRILSNQTEGFEDGIILEGQVGQVSEIEIDRNQFRNGLRGMRATAGFRDLVVRNNVAQGNRSIDVDIRGPRPLPQP